jgi:protocatechuate 3,4-dioxygenase beta subunit
MRRGLTAARSARASTPRCGISDVRRGWRGALIPICPIVQTIPDPQAIEQLTAGLDMNATIPLDSIAYRFDIVLRGRRSTLFENRLEEN